MKAILLRAGAVAAPLFTVAVLAQAALRPGYDLTRHPASVLAQGEHGWVQIAVFLVTGALTLAGAVGIRHTVGDLRGPQGEASRAGLVGGRLVAGLLAVQGAGLVVAGIFRMDPVDGFPVGTPAGQPETFSTAALVHNAAGSVSFLALIVACFVLARRIGGRWAAVGVAAGVAFTAGLVWALSGGAAGSLTLFLGVVVAWTWVAATEVRLSR
jgi:hypothetical protein